MDINLNALNQFRDELIRRERGTYLEGEYLLVSDIVRGKCSWFCEQFKLMFPDLRIARGFCNQHEHYWLVQPSGAIYDPTFAQFLFPTLPIYRELNEAVDLVRVGKCMNCGDEIYGLIKDGHKCVCSAECREILSKD